MLSDIQRIILEDLNAIAKWDNTPIGGGPAPPRPIRTPQHIRVPPRQRVSQRPGARKITKLRPWDHEKGRYVNRIER
jgi:hypothetical protein